MPVSLILSAIEPSVERVHHFNPEVVDGSIEFQRAFTRTFTGVLGELGYMTWAYEQGLRPSPPVADKYFAPDLIIGKAKVPTEIKSYKNFLLKTSNPYIYKEVASRLVTHSKIIVFLGLGLNKVIPDYDKMAELYRYGINLDILGWIYNHQLEKFPVTGPKHREQIIIPQCQMNNYATLINVVNPVQIQRDVVDHKFLHQKAVHDAQQARKRKDKYKKRSKRGYSAYH